jgi:iron complex outermembrane receptor protein
LNLDWSYYFDEHNQLTIKAGRQFNIREEFDKEQPRNQDLVALDIPEMSLSLESYLADLSWTHEKSKGMKVESGFNFRNKENRVNSFIDFIPDYQSNEIGAFSVLSKKLKKWEFEGGVRLNHKNFEVSKITQRGVEDYDLDFTTYHASLSGKRQLFNRFESDLTYTYSERAPEINELFGEGLHHGTASIETGNRDIQKERMQELSVGVKTDFGKLSSTTYLYVKYIEDFIYLKADGIQLTIRGAFPTFSWNNTDALIKGVDKQLKYPITENLSLESKWSFIWGNNVSQGDYLIFMPANRTMNNLVYRFKLTKNASSKMTVRLGQQYVFSQNRFNESEEIATPPQAYQLFHASLNVPLINNGLLNAKMSVSVQNIFNTKYRDYLNRFRYFTDAQGRNINIHLKINF